MKRAVVLAVMGAVQLAGQAAYLNPELTPEARAADLVSRMTLQEKVLQMQNTAPGIARLGVPAYNWWNEGLHGVARAGLATVFPQAIGLAATWDTDLMHRVADTISTEARAKYNEALRHDDHGQYHGLTFWSPNINIFRDPRWGRGQETYGEDPFLTGRMAVAFIQGMQGNDPHYLKVVSTAKHFAVHSGPESTRHQFDSQPSERDLNDTYLPAFRAAIVEGKADSVMCAYNSLDGAPACANTDLLQKHLRGDWGFQGYVVSDCGAVSDIYRFHHWKATAGESSAAAVKAGTDLTCGTEYRSLVGAVTAGQITEAEINTSIERLFVARFRLGMFDPPERVPFSKIPYTEVDSAAHRQTALEAARKSIVLLKNEKETLPLKASVKRIAVIGPSADDPEAMLGNYNGFSSKEVTPLEGMEKQFAGKVRFALGATYTTQSMAPVPVDVLTPPEGTGHGLLAEYFEGLDFQGEPKLRRVEARAYQASGVPDAAVAAAFPHNGYSVRWTGTLKTAVGGDYAITLRVQPAAEGVRPQGVVVRRVFLDDQELVAAPAAAPAAGRGGRGPAPPLVAQLEAGRAYRLKVEYSVPAGGGFGQLVWIPPAEALLAEAVAAVKSAEVTVAFVGLNPSLEGEEMPIHIEGFAGGDRTDLKLPEPQEKLIEAAAATGKPLVVVLTSGSAVAANFPAERAAAVLEAWYGGEEIGTAVAETLAGVNNPAGRLPVTFYKSVEQLPAFDDYNMKGRTYRYFTGDPLWGFGYGLSYAKFQYSGLQVTEGPGGWAISAQVKNVSKREGDEVAQLYVNNAAAAPGDDAIRELRGFTRVHLRAGETRTVTFTIAAADVPKYRARVSVGGGQPVGSVARVEQTGMN